MRASAFGKNKSIMKKINFLFIKIILLLFISKLAIAATATASLPVSASVTQVCSVSTSTALAFAIYDPIGTNATAPLNSIGQISVACSKGASGLTIGMDNGVHVSGTQRQMIGAVNSNLLSYSIYQPSSTAALAVCTFPGTTLWTNTGLGMFTLTSSTSRVARVYNVCGTISGGQDVAADTYADTVIATITF